MRYPQLVRKNDCKTPIIVTIYTEDIGENGEPIVYGEVEATCNYQSSAKQRMDDQKHYIDVSGIALLWQNIFPELNELTHGTVQIFGETREIIKGIKARNPDGSVNFVRLELK